MDKLTFFEHEIEEILVHITENIFNDLVKEVCIKANYEIPYGNALNLKLLKDDDTLTRIHFKLYFENTESFEGDFFINITSYSSINLFHVRFIYRDNGKIPVCLYHIYDLYKPNSESQSFETSGEEANVSQYEFIHYDKPIGKLFNNVEILHFLQELSLKLIRTYYTDKQRNKI